MQLGSMVPMFKINRYLTRSDPFDGKLTKLPFSGPYWDVPHIMRHELPVVWCRDYGRSLRLSDHAEPIVDSGVFYRQTA